MNQNRKIVSRAWIFKNRKWFTWFLICFLIGSFIILTSEVREALAGEKEMIGTIDQALLSFVVEHRTQSLNGLVIDMTALGSALALSILTLFTCTFFLFRQRPHLALHSFLAAGGAAVLTSALKFYFERSRPEVSLRLVEVQGFSYPSGHSLSSAAIYFTCAILVAKQLTGLGSRAFMWVFFSVSSD